MFDNIVTNNQVNFNDLEKKIYKFVCELGCCLLKIALENYDKKIKDRELLRLENSIIDGIRKYGEDKPIIVCMHYPPLLKELKNSEFTKILEKYNVKYCLYGHLHGKSHMNVFDGNYNNVAYKMVSCDYTGFKLIKII